MSPAKLLSYGKYFSNGKFIYFVTHVGKKIGFLRKAMVLFYCLRDPETPKSIKALIAGALGYLILPVDVVPDVLSVFGWVDDLAVLTIAFKAADKYIKPTHRELAKKKIPFGKD